MCMLYWKEIHVEKHVLCTARPCFAKSFRQKFTQGLCEAGIGAHERCAPAQGGTQAKGKDDEEDAGLAGKTKKQKAGAAGKKPAKKKPAGAKATRKKPGKAAAGAKGKKKK